MSPLWIPCPLCDCFWCVRHDMHAHECPCPPIEDLDFDPLREPWEPGLWCELQSDEEE